MTISLIAMDVQDGRGEKVTRSRESSAKTQTADFPTSHGRSAQSKPHKAGRHGQIVHSKQRLCTRGAELPVKGLRVPDLLSRAMRL